MVFATAGRGGRERRTGAAAAVGDVARGGGGATPGFGFGVGVGGRLRLRLPGEGAREDFAEHRGGWEVATDGWRGGWWAVDWESATRGVDGPRSAGSGVSRIRFYECRL